MNIAGTPRHTDQRPGNPPPPHQKIDDKRDNLQEGSSPGPQAGGPAVCPLGDNHTAGNNSIDKI